jgi:hypothetical protein
VKLSTAYNHKNRLANKLRNVYGCAVYDRPTHRLLCERVSADVWSDPALKHCPRWVTTALMEVRHSLSEQIYSHLVWAFIGSDGSPRQLNDLPEDDRQAVFKGEIKGTISSVSLSKLLTTLSIALWISFTDITLPPSTELISLITSSFEKIEDTEF